MAGKIQNEDIKSSAELISAGGTAAQLPNDTKVYVTASSINKTLNQAIIDGDIGGGSGGINYIPLSQSNGASASGWTVYANAAGTAPVNGTGGSPSSTFATSANTSLIGANNYLWTKSAANRQGEGFSYNFSIDAGYQAKPITISFLYSIASGTYASGDMTVWIYDVTNAVLIQPSAYSILNGSGAIVQKCEFQAASNSTSYRLIVHTSTTSASAYSLRFDAFSVSPNTYNSGASITDWQTYTPTFTAMGTPTAVAFAWRRVGGSIEVEGKFNCGSPTASQARVSLPSGLTISSDSSIGPTFRGAGNLYQGQNGAVAGYVIAESGFTYMTFGIQGAGNTGLTQANGITVFANTVVYTMSATFPIAGWGTSQVLSNDTDTRVVAVKAYYNGSAYAYTANNDVILSSLYYDTHSSFNTSTYKYTVPVAGKYQIGLSFIGKTAGLGTFYVSKNGGTTLTGDNILVSATNEYKSGCTSMDFIAGDQISLKCDTGSGSIFGGALSISRISGPSQIAASEKIIAYYSRSADVSTTALTQINFDVKNIDTHSAVTTGAGAWKFTAPRSDYYHFDFMVLANGTTTDWRLYKNGSVDRFICVSGATNNGTGASGIIQLLAGDYIDFRPSATGTVFGGSGVANYSQVYIWARN